MLIDLKYLDYESFDKERPENLDKMLEIATILSKDFSFVRVDFFDLKRKVVFIINHIRTRWWIWEI